MLNRKYEFKGMDLTLDVYEKLRAVVELLAEGSGRSFDAELAAFTRSRTYAVLVDPRSLMWSESPRFVTEEYLREVS